MVEVRQRLEPDGTLRDSARRSVSRRIDAARVDMTSESGIARHMAEDAAAEARDAAAYARRVRRRTGLTQSAFAARIGVPIDTVRNWEQGKRLPAGAGQGTAEGAGPGAGGGVGGAWCGAGAAGICRSGEELRDGCTDDGPLRRRAAGALADARKARDHRRRHWRQIPGCWCAEIEQDRCLILQRKDI